MIDIHAHILPGIDDGPRNMDESIAMLRLAVADGIRTMVATPHYDGADPGLPCLASATMRETRRQIAEHGLDLQVLSGFELSLTPELINRFDDWESLGLNGSRYLLIECPVAYWSDYVEEGLFRLQAAGMRPILAHAERYDSIIDDIEVANRLASRDILLQVNADSLTGSRGRDHARCARALVKRGIVSFLATDSHSPRSRSPHLHRAAGVAARLIGSEAAERLVASNPHAVLNNAEIPEPPPIRRFAFFSTLSRSLKTERQPIPEHPTTMTPAVSIVKTRG